MFVTVCSLRESVTTGRFFSLLKRFFLLSARSAQCLVIYIYILYIHNCDNNNNNNNNNNIIIYYYTYTFLLYISWVDVEEKHARQVRAIKIINKEKARFGDVAM